MIPSVEVETRIGGMPAVCPEPAARRPSTVESVRSMVEAEFAAIVSLPGCDGADWLPLACELPELGAC